MGFLVRTVLTVLFVAFLPVTFPYHLWCAWLLGRGGASSVPCILTAATRVRHITVVLLALLVPLGASGYWLFGWYEDAYEMLVVAFGLLPGLLCLGYVLGVSGLHVGLNVLLAKLLRAGCRIEDAQTCNNLRQGIVLWAGVHELLCRIQRTTLEAMLGEVCLHRTE